MRFKLFLVLVLLISCTDDMSLLTSKKQVLVIGNSPILYAPFDFYYGATGLSYSTTIVKGSTIVSKLELNSSITHSDTMLAQYESFSVNGTELIGAGDNIAPVYYGNKIIGGKHGYTANRKDWSHGKTYADIGSVWTNGTDEIVIYAVEGSRLRMTKRGAANTYITAGTYTHVSGATNTDDLDLTTGLVASILFPSTKRLPNELWIDGVQEDETTSATFTVVKKVVVKTAYEILERQSLVESIITANSAARTTPLLESEIDGTSEVRISVDYMVNGYGSVVQNYKFESLVSLPSFYAITALQQINEITTGDKWYIPKISGATYDWANIVNYFDIPGDDVFVLSDFGSTGLVCDVMTQIKTGVGYYAMGFLPVKDGAIGTRRGLLSFVGSMADTEKQYMKAVYLNPAITLPSGTIYESVGYKGVFPVETDRTLHYFIPDFENETIYMRADWHVTKTDALPIPSELQGRSYTIVEKSDNVTLSDGTLGSTLSVGVDCSTITNAYLLIKIS